uniref:Uncharacterized protein n=1 Tax=Oryza barthii TaxID=65489 RepID=A0A0D3FUP3_9ORYZ
MSYLVVVGLENQLLTTRIQRITRITIFCWSLMLGFLVVVIPQFSFPVIFSFASNEHASIRTFLENWFQDDFTLLMHRVKEEDKQKFQSWLDTIQ